MSAALEDALSLLQLTALKKTWTALVERDFQRALETATGARPARVELERWPQLGAVDLMLPGDVGSELKWCRSGDTLANCAWDVAKLACALAEETVAEGWIVGGAPVTHWGSGALGTEIFLPRLYTNDRIVAGYESWWRFWCNDVTTRPIDLPRSFAVTAAEKVVVRLDDEPFEIALARVEATDPTWRPHVCPHRWRGELCPPRPWDPDGYGGLAP